jgi:hypothetical protein
VLAKAGCWRSLRHQGSGIGSGVSSGVIAGVVSGVGAGVRASVVLSIGAGVRVGLARASICGCWHRLGPRFSHCRQSWLVSERELVQKSESVQESDWESIVASKRESVQAKVSVAASEWELVQESESVQQSNWESIVVSK